MLSASTPSCGPDVVGSAAPLPALAALGDASPVAPRLGSVEMTDVQLLPEPKLQESDAFQKMSDRLQRSEAVVDALRERGDPRLDAILTETLDRLVAEGRIDGLLIGSEDGFVVAQSTRLDRGELMAVVGVLFEMTVRRLQEEDIIPSVQEMSARGGRGEQIVLRFFPELSRRMFLLAYSRTPAAYRRTTSRALKRCGEILARAVGESTVPHRVRRARKPAAQIPPTESPASTPFPPAPAEGLDANPPGEPAEDTQPWPKSPNSTP